MSGVTQGKGKMNDLLGKGSANKAAKKAAAKKAAWAKVGQREVVGWEGRGEGEKRGRVQARRERTLNTL